MKSQWAKVGGTLVLWAAIGCICWILGTFDLLRSAGAGWMVFGGFALTFVIWINDR
jgi:hypothetical protein